MPSWKRVIVGGSDASLNSLNITAALTASGITYPSTDGTSGQVIITNGSGQLTFSTIASGGTGSSVKLIQTTPASTWTFTHNLNEKFPAVTIYDENDEVIIPLRIEAQDVNTLIIYFSTLRVGTAAAVVGGSTVSASFAQTASHALYALTASYLEGYVSPFPFTGSAIITGSLEVTGSTYLGGVLEVGGNIVPKTAQGATLGTVDRPFSDIFVSSGSINIASDVPGDPNTSISNVEGNLLISAGGIRLLGSASFIAETGSFQYISGSMTQEGDYNQTGNYTLIGDKTITGSLSVSGSIIATGGFLGNANTATTASYALTASYLENPTVSGSINQIDILSFTTGSEHVLDAAQIAWNPVDGTFNMGLIGGVTLQTGQEMSIYGKAVGTISNGDAIMFAGSEGDHLLIASATQAVINQNPEYLIGIATQDFTNNQYGYVIVFGKVRGLSTIAHPGGTVLYFDSEGSTAGALTSTEPSAPSAKVKMAAVIRSHNTEGILMVRPYVMPKLEDIQDVGITNATEGDLLVRNSNTWRNTKQLSGSYEITGSLEVQGTVRTTSSIQVGSNSNTASATNIGSIRYRTSGNNSYVDMVMQTGASTYEWVNIVENNW